MVDVLTNNVEGDCEKQYGRCPEKKQYEYDEALEMSGNGKYNIYLLITLSLTVLAMGVDMFGFTVVVVGASCELNINQQQKSILMSMPFAGVILSAYAWGYYSDTQGRKKALVIAMVVSCICSTVSAFSPNWICLAILKFFSACFCSCAQSVSYTLLGESCINRVKDTYILIMTSLLMLTQCIVYIPGYFILDMKFYYDMGFIHFTPWRFLVLMLVLPLLLSIFCLYRVYESPKFLLNQDREGETLEVLKNIYIRNHGNKDDYKIHRLVLRESQVLKVQDVRSFLKSLWEQAAVLFRQPLLWRSLQLYFLTGIMYSANNAFLMWFPFLANAFFSGLNYFEADQPSGLCHMISSHHLNSTVSAICDSSLDFWTTVASVFHSFSFFLINLCICKMAARRKLVMMTLFLISGTAGFLVVLIPSNMISFVVYFFYQMVGLNIGLVYSYFIDLYPTSHRGMASCLAVMVARGSALGGINLVGAYIMSYCSYAFYFSGAFIFSGLLVAAFLPADRRKNK